MKKRLFTASAIVLIIVMLAASLASCSTDMYLRILEFNDYEITDDINFKGMDIDYEQNPILGFPIRCENIEDVTRIVFAWKHMDVEGDENKQYNNYKMQFDVYIVEFEDENGAEIYETHLGEYNANAALKSLKAARKGKIVIVVEGSYPPDRNVAEEMVEKELKKLAW